MNRLPWLIFLAITAFAFVACNPAKQVAKKLSGTWVIAGFEDKKAGAEPFKAISAGTVSFFPDNSGNAVLRFNILGPQTNDTIRFSWSNTENILTLRINQTNETKAWIMMKVRKNYLLFKSTDGAGSVQVMNLKRLKK